MSLPRALPGIFLTGKNNANTSRHGPIYANGAVYLVTSLTVVGDTDLVIYKSTDPDTTAFTQQDSGNQPRMATGVAGQSGFSLALELVGDVIHIATHALDLDHDQRVGYWRYDTSADTWTTGHGAWGDVGIDESDNPSQVNLYPCDIKVHTVSSNETIQILYIGSQLKVHGTLYDRIYISTFDGTSWTVDRTFDARDATGQWDYWPGCLVKAAGVERIHGLVKSDSSSDTNIHSISSSDVITLENAQEIASVPRATGVSYDDGTVRIRVASGDNVIEFDDAAAPSTFTLNTRSEFATGGSAFPVRVMALDGEDEYLLYVRSSDDNLYYDLNDGATDVLFETLKQADSRWSASQTSYTVGGRLVIGYFYKADADLVYQYDEILLSAPAAAVRPAATLVGLNATKRAGFF